MEESDTYLMILDQGQGKRKEDILIIGEENFGTPNQSIRGQLESIVDLERLERMVRRAVKAASWQEILDTK